MVRHLSCHLLVAGQYIIFFKSFYGLIPNSAILRCLDHFVDVEVVLDHATGWAG